MPFAARKVASYFVAAVTAAMISFAHAAPGQIDLGFGANGVAIHSYAGSFDNRAGGFALQPDGKLLVAGRCSRQSYGHCVSRYLPNGDVDTSFGGGTGQVFLGVSSPTDVYPISVQSDGKIVVAADCAGVCVSRLTSSGDLDTTYGAQGVAQYALPTTLGMRVNDLLVDPLDRVVVFASCRFSGDAVVSERRRFCAYRLLTTGNVDSSFGNGAVTAEFGGGTQALWGSNAVRLASGDLLFGGTCTPPSGYPARFCVARMTDSGGATTMFSGQGSFISSSPLFVSTVDGAQLTSTGTGKILVTGRCVGPQNNYDVCLVRHNADGSLDSNFGTNGTSVVQLGDGDDSASTLLLDDDRIFLAGGCFLQADLTTYPGPVRVCSAMLSEAGAVDTSYGVGGFRRDALQAPAAEWGGVYAYRANRNGSITGAGTISLIDSTTPPGSSARFLLTRLQTYAGADASCSLNVDGNLVTRFSTDASLVVRYLLGLRGTALTDGAVGPNPGRTNAEIEAYLADLLAQGKLDADGDGQTLAMTDGLLILRAMLGFSGDALTAGAVNATHPNVRNAQQILTWVESTHGVACLP